MVAAVANGEVRNVRLSLNTDSVQGPFEIPGGGQGPRDARENSEISVLKLVGPRNGNLASISMFPRSEFAAGCDLGRRFRDIKARMERYRCSKSSKIAQRAFIDHELRWFFGFVSGSELQRRIGRLQFINRDIA